MELVCQYFGKSEISAAFYVMYLNESQIAAHHSPLLFRVVQLPRVGLREKKRDDNSKETDRKREGGGV